jgi:predicted nucleotidyltransferase
MADDSLTIDLPDKLAERRAYSHDRLRSLVARLEARGADPLTGTTACVYATGSVARGEASPHSDLDLFIVANGSQFRELDMIRLKANLIEASSEEGFPEFSGDGEYLNVHLTSDLALAFLCHLFRQHGTISQERMIDVLAMTPLERVARIGFERESVRPLTRSLLERYDAFLETCAAGKTELLSRFSMNEFHEAQRTEAQAFGDNVFELLVKLAEDTPLLRYMLV